MADERDEPQFLSVQERRKLFEANSSTPNVKNSSARSDRINTSPSLPKRANTLAHPNVSKPSALSSSPKASSITQQLERTSFSPPQQPTQETSSDFSENNPFSDNEITIVEDSEENDSEDDSDCDDSDSDDSDSDYSDSEERLAQPVRDTNSSFESASFDGSRLATTPPHQQESLKQLKSSPPPPPPLSARYHHVARKNTIDAPITRAHTIAVAAGRKNTRAVPALQSSVPPEIPPRPVQYTSLLQEQNPPPLPNRPNRSNQSHSVDGYPLEMHKSHKKRSVIPSTMSLQKNMEGATDTSVKLPDTNTADRAKPFLYDQNLATTISGNIDCLAVMGKSVAVGNQKLQIWNISDIYSRSKDFGGHTENGNKYCAMTFSLSRDHNGDGQYLWVGQKDGSLSVVDIHSGIPKEKPKVHKHAISRIIRHESTEVWVLDEEGYVSCWPAHPINENYKFIIQVKNTKNVIKSDTKNNAWNNPKSETFILIRDKLWVAEGNTLCAYNIKPGGVAHESFRLELPSEIGEISGIATLPYHADKIFLSHKPGRYGSISTVNVDKIGWSNRDTSSIEWKNLSDNKRNEIFQNKPISNYSIHAIASVNDYYLWVGFNTGFIYVFDTRPNDWVIIKAWKAHDSAISYLLVDDTNFSSGVGNIQVISGNDKIIHIWDGLLKEYMIDQIMREKHIMDAYCDYRRMNVLVSSWNIDATKPERIRGSDIKEVHKWLSMENADIIVVGIQEIVDLESKKQTAKSLFSLRKKSDLDQSADELLKHRYKQWHDYLITTVSEIYGYDRFVVKKTDQLVGLFSCVFIRKDLAAECDYVESTLVKTGMKVLRKSLHGNKGGIAIRFRYKDSSFCFVNCHLAAGQKHTNQRNTDAEKILSKLKAFNQVETPYKETCVNGGDGTMIIDHEHCFLSGDLNYRIEPHKDSHSVQEHKDSRSLQEKNDVVNTIMNGERDKLIEYDQLTKERSGGSSHQKLFWFKEMKINFDPTYKYDRGTNTYDTSEKHRIPSWCDRVLYRSEDMEPLFYRRHEVLVSDHRPISAGFQVRVKSIKSGDYHKVRKYLRGKDYNTIVQEYMSTLTGRRFT